MTNNDSNPTLATLSTALGLRPEDLQAAIALIKGTAPTATPAVQTSNQEKMAKLRAMRGKKAAASTPAVAPVPAASVAPVAPVTLANGMKVNITPQYKAMVAFVHLAIRKLRDAYNATSPKRKTKGCHSTASGFLAAFMKQYGLNKEQAITVLDTMTERGDLQKHPARHGFMLYVPGEMPERSEAKDPDDVLKLILG